MPSLQVKPLPVEPDQAVSGLAPNATIEQELDAILADVLEFDASAPDVVIAHCMAYMARCTEIYLNLVRIEGTVRRAKFIRTMQLQKVMDLLDFEFKGASRLIEVARQELDTVR